MGVSASHPLFPALQSPADQNSADLDACTWPGVRPWHSLAGAAPISREEREFWLQVVARCFTFCAQNPHPRLRWRRLAALRLVSRGWDAAFGRFLETSIVEDQSRTGSPPGPGALPHIGTVAVRPFLAPPGSIPLDPVLLKCLSLPNVNEALSQRFVTETQFGALNFTQGVFRDYSTMRRLRRLRGLSSFQIALLPMVPLRSVGRCVSFAFPWLRGLSLYGSLATASDLEEFNGLPHLTELDLSWCLKIERFEGLLYFPSLTALNLQATIIDGVALYAYVTHMRDLRTLNLVGCYKLASVDFCQLLACLPELEQLLLTAIPTPRLEPYLPRRESSLSVELSHTKLDGATLEGWCRAPLRSIGLEYCLTLAAPDLQALRWLAPTLTTLNLRQNGRLTSDSLAFLSFLRNLQHISVARCPNVDDTAMEYMRDLPSVKALDLEYTSVTDRGLRCLQQWTALRRLNIVGVQCTVDSLPLLAALADRSLRTLELAGCKKLDSSAVIYLRQLAGLTVHC